MEEIAEKEISVKAKKNTITRKIELYIDDVDKEHQSEIRKKLWDWNEKCLRAANTIVSHLYIQMNMQELAYFNEDFKNNNPEIFKQGPGYSPSNRTYRLIAETYKGEMPSDIYSNLNAQITSVFQKEKKEYFKGTRALRTYKRGIPMPFSAKCLTSIRLDEKEKDYTFTWFGIPLVTRFGRDLSGNKEIWERSLGLSPEYKFCNSSLQIDGAKIYLLAVFQFESTKFNLKEDTVMEAYLSVTVPIALRFKSKTFSIGDKKEFLHRRLAIQGSLKRQQIASRYTAGGHGRNKKIAGTERFSELESDFVTSKHHLYSRKLIALCLQNKCDTLILKYVHEIKCPEELKGLEKKKWYEENEFILRNWTYYGLIEKIKYKCKIVGINLIIETKPKD